jgi:hypothetical protein
MGKLRHKIVKKVVYSYKIETYSVLTSESVLLRLWFTAPREKSWDLDIFQLRYEIFELHEEGG